MGIEYADRRQSSGAVESLRRFQAQRAREGQRLIETRRSQVAAGRRPPGWNRNELAAVKLALEADTEGAGPR